MREFHIWYYSPSQKLMAAEVTGPYIDSAYYFIKWSCHNYFLNIYAYTEDLLSNFVTEGFISVDSSQWRLAN